MCANILAIFDINYKTFSPQVRFYILFWKKLSYCKLSISLVSSFRKALNCFKMIFWVILFENIRKYSEEMQARVLINQRAKGKTYWKYSTWTIHYPKGWLLVYSCVNGSWAWHWHLVLLTRDKLNVITVSSVPYTFTSKSAVSRLFWTLVPWSVYWSVWKLVFSKIL